jgi:hypothetical protein
MKKAAATNKCTLEMEALKQYMWHRLMQHVKGYTGSHLTLPLGDYLLRIALVAARATSNKTMMQNIPLLLAISMAIAMWQYSIKYIARWRRSRAFIKATKCCHWASTRSDSTNWAHQRQLILTFHREKVLELTCWPLILIGV